MLSHIKFSKALDIDCNKLHNYDRARRLNHAILPSMEKISKESGWTGEQANIRRRMIGANFFT